MVELDKQLTSNDCLSPDQLQSSPPHHINSVFVACSTVLPYLLCLFPCSLLLFFFSRSSLFPSSHFLLLLIAFYRSNCSNQLYKRRLWWYGVLWTVEQKPRAGVSSWRRHHRRETGMLKSVHHTFVRMQCNLFLADIAHNTDLCMIEYCTQHTASDHCNEKHCIVVGLQIYWSSR